MVRDTDGDRNRQTKSDACAVISQRTSRALEKLSLDDLKILSTIVRLRLLTFSQIHRLLFPDRHPTLTRRRLRALRDAGWLAFRDAPRRNRRGVRFALPTQRALAAVLPHLGATTAVEPFGALVAAMLPRPNARPLTFADGTTPKWLPHQQEVNELVTRIATSTRAIQWASSWDAPLPSGGGIELPQPDYVLVETAQGGPRIVFGEHDRGSEPVERFIARKIALYTDLQHVPEVGRALWGDAPFVVHVSVIDVVRRRPMDRLRLLLEAASFSPYPDLFRFTLGGWLAAYPDAPIFFSALCEPAIDALDWHDHRTTTG